MAGRRKQRKRSPRKQAKTKQRFLRWGLGALGALLILCLVAFLYVRSQIQQHLASRSFQQNSAIYSDILRLKSGSGLSRADLERILLDRSYRSKPQANLEAGEFNCSPKSCRIITREFKTREGQLLKSKTIEFPFETEQAVELVLEPKALESLRQENARASSPRQLTDFPLQLREAVRAIEDERFFSHPGIDLSGMLRALWVNVGAGRVVQGGSTLTQQLAKNLFLSPERSISRKLLEVVTAICLELQLSKDEVLELYLNEVYLGQQGSTAIHGMAQASQFFFAKDVEQLSLAEAAMLAGIIKAPSIYSPKKHFSRARERSHLVLAKMQELGIITSQNRQRAEKERINISKSTLMSGTSGHLIQAIKQQVKNDLGANSSASEIAIYTGINDELQICAEDEIRKSLKQHRKGLEVGLVAINQANGNVLAWVGGRNYSENQFDHVSQAKRPIGSTIKPFLYLTALDAELNNYRAAKPTSILDDSPMQIRVGRKIWEPQNFDHEFRGRVTLRYALENSLNLPAVYVVERVGVPAFLKTLSLFGLSEDTLPVPAIALGALDASLLQLTTAFAALANEGVFVVPRLFLAALDHKGNVLAQSKSKQETIASKPPVFVLTNMLQGVIERGTAKSVRRAGFKDQAAGKTGTSDDNRDAWFIGFTPEITVGVWLGFDDNRKLAITGGSAAAPIWAGFMNCAARFIDHSNFTAPPGVVFSKIDASSGEIATPSCPANLIVDEVFVAGTEPKRGCHTHAGKGTGAAPQLEFGEPVQERRRSFWEQIFG